MCADPIVLSPAPTHHLTLTRTAQEVIDLHRKITTAHPDLALPDVPLHIIDENSESLLTDKKRKSSFLASLTGSSSSSSSQQSQQQQQQQQQDAGLWRTQSATLDLRRSQSRESQLAAAENAKRPRSSSTAAGQQRPVRRQLKMLNGRVYGAKRNNLNGVNLFASAR